MKILISLTFLMLSTLNFYSLKAQSVLSNFRINDSHKNRVYFDSSSGINGISIKGFVISDKTIVSINTKNLYFEVNEPFTFYDNVTIRLENGNNVIDDFSIQYVLNNLSEPKSSVIRYVSVDGKGNGLSESDTWSLSMAFKNAKPGMTIYVKSGNYGKGNYSLSTAGTAEKPIKFIGYKDVPGDTPRLNMDPNTSFSSSTMPYLRKKYSSTYGDNGIDLEGHDYVIFKNFQIEGYYYGINASESNNTTIENCYIRDTYIGINFWRSTGGVKNARVINSYSSNARQDGILLNGKYGLIDNCYVSSNKTIGMDYYIGVIGSLKGDGGHIVRNCEVVRYKGDSHTGHGIDIKAQRKGTKIEYCLIENCIVSNVRQSISLRHHSVRYNVVRGAKVFGDKNGDSNLITFRDDSSYNTIENCLADNVNVAIKFNMSVKEDLGRQGGGHHNRIINSVFKGCKYIIDVKGIDGEIPLKSTYNEIINCTFYGGDYMFNGTAIYDNTNSIKNCVIMGITKKVFKGNFNPTLINNNFFKSYDYPKKDGNMSEDPQFENSSNGNFNLKPGSPMIDKGQKIEGIKLDFNGNLRPQGAGIDIGAFEYQDSSTSFIRANAGDDRTICKGETITLEASGGVQYAWSNGETTKSIEVSPDETTTYEVIVSDGNSSDKDMVLVTVLEVVADAGQDLAIIKDDEVTLSATGGDTYLWSNGETTASITVKPNITTIYTVTVTLNGCTDQDEVKVTVEEKDNESVVAFAGDDVTICKGETVMLTASGGDQYTWSNGETNQSITVSPTETTFYEVSVSKGNISDIDQVLVTVQEVQADAGNDLTINEGDEVTLIATGGDSYLWSNGEATSSITVKPKATTTYTVTVNKSGCEDVDEVLVTVIPQVSDGGQLIDDSEEDVSLAEEPKSLEIQVYPNPTTGILQLESNNVHPDLNIHLINSNGQILYQDKSNSENTRFSKRLDFSSFTKGIYFVRFVNSYHDEVKKVVLI